MRPATTLALVVVAVAAVAGGWYLGRTPASVEQTATAAGTLAFPDLTPKLAGAARIEVQHQANTLVVVRQGDRWGLADRGGYPVQATKVRELTSGLAELRLMEPRTSDPAEYGRLGVEDPAGATATSNLLRVLDGGGAPIAALIVGHRRVRTQGDVPETIYVRRPGEAQAWLAEGRLSVDADPQLWIDRDIANIDHAKIAAVHVARGAETLDFARDGDKLVLKSPAEHPKLDEYRLEDVGRAFETLTLTDVKPAAQEPGDKLGESVFTTTDGMTITTTGYKVGSGDKAEFWAQFAVAGDGAAKPQADALKARLEGWAYQLGSWKEAALLPSLDLLKAAEPTPAPAAGAPGGLPAGLPPGLLPGSAPDPAAAPPPPAPGK